MTIRLLQVDAFTGSPFAGNPAAVCLLEEARDEAWMQAVAQEMNLSETAYPVREGDAFQLRWFTPEVEVSLCGHATLATSHALWEEGIAAAGEPIRYRSASGPLTARKKGDLIVLDFPAEPDEPIPKPPAGLADALGITPEYVGYNGKDHIFLVDSADTVRKLDPDTIAMRNLCPRCVIVTAPGDGEFDFISRVFAPGAGIHEDPVTGAAHCCLGPFWARRTGKTKFKAFQASKRGGRLDVRVEGDRVFLGGRAVTVLRGELLV